MIEKIKERLQKKITYYNAQYESFLNRGILSERAEARFKAYKEAIDIVNEVEAKYNNGWISVEDELPPVETEVLIVAKRKYRDGICEYITTTAMYEDGTVLENDSCWLWEDIEGEWNEEEDCYVIPKGWWEYKHYNVDGVFNNTVYGKVIYWQPLPQSPKGE